MKAFFATLSLTGLLFGSLHAQATYPVTQGKLYKFEKVGDGVYLATGGVGGNEIVIVNDQDVVLVDDGTTPATARALVADIKLLTPKPIRTVINTHFHYDHSDGNSVFGPEVQIIAHDFVRQAILNFDVLHREPFTTSQFTRIPREMSELQKKIADEKDSAAKAKMTKDLADLKELQQQENEIKPTPPNTTYSSKMVLYRGGREIQLLFLGRGHTGGDTFVYLPKERIICTGDEEEGPRASYMGDAYFDEWVKTLDALKQLDFGLVLPGHGRPFSDKAIITGFQSYLTDLIAKLTVLRKQGVSADDAAKRVDMTNHSKDLPVNGLGADLRGVRHFYAWMDEREGKK